MPKKRSKKLNFNTIQLNVIRTLRRGGFLTKTGYDNFRLMNVANESIPIANKDNYSIQELIIKSYIKKEKSIKEKVSDYSTEKEFLELTITTYIITDKGITSLAQLDQDIPCRLKVEYNDYTTEH